MTDRDIVMAFEAGRRAASRDQPFAGNPFMPETQRELYEAWNEGYTEEQGPTYLSMKTQERVDD